MQGARPAKPHQGKFTRVIPLLNRNHPQRAKHVFIDDIQNTLCRLILIESQRSGDLADSLFCRLQI